MSSPEAAPILSSPSSTGSTKPRTFDAEWYAPSLRRPEVVPPEGMTEAECVEIVLAWRKRTFQDARDEREIEALKRMYPRGLSLGP